MSLRGERQLMIVERLKQSTESSKEIMIAKNSPCTKRNRKTILVKK